MRVNGTEIDLAMPITLERYLFENQYDLTRIAVERNHRIVPKSRYAEVILNPQDTLEIVRFVGGG